MGFIYCIFDQKNGFRYIGQTKYSVEKRFKAHQKQKQKTYFHNALQKRFDDFYIEWQAEYSNDDLNCWETYYISFYNSFFPQGYNMTSGGDTPDFISDETRKKCKAINLGRKHTDESRKNMSIAHLGKKQSLETIEKNRNAHLGKKKTLETIEKLRQAHLGRKHTDESRKNMSIAHLGKKQSLETREKNRQTHLGKKASIEARENMSKAQKGHKCSAETRIKMSEVHVGTTGKKYSEESRLRMSIAQKKRYEKIKLENNSQHVLLLEGCE